METNENHALTKAEGCYHCKPLVQQRNELAAQVGRFKSVIEAVANIGVDFGYGAYEIQTDTIDFARVILSEPQSAALAELKAQWQDEAIEEIIHCLFYAPSSPIKPNKAEEIKIWWGKYKHAQEAGDD